MYMSHFIKCVRSFHTVWIVCEKPKLKGFCLAPVQALLVHSADVNLHPIQPTGVPGGIPVFAADAAPPAPGRPGTMRRAGA